MKRRAAHNFTEFDEQALVIEWCEMHPLANHIFATPNGIPIGQLTPQKQTRMKKSGLKAGVADLFLPIPQRAPDGEITACGMFIEMKKKRGGVLAANQSAFLRRMQELGYAVVCANGADEAIAAITAYLAGKDIKKLDRT